VTNLPSKITGETVRNALKVLGIATEMEQISRVEIGLRFVTVESWDRSSRPPIHITHQYPISWADKGEIIR